MPLKSVFSRHEGDGVKITDEPTGALDAKAAELSFSLIKDLCRKYHKTVIMVTHSLDLAQRADRVIDLANYK